MIETIKGEKIWKSDVICRDGAFYDNISRLTQGHNNLIVIDEKVDENFGDIVDSVFPEDTPVYIMPSGEKNKNFNRLGDILKYMTEEKLHRNDTVFAIGGGVVGDITGLAASLYMRGIKLVQVPTTLLAQVDSSVGGKTAVDMNGVKNIVGSFYQPETVIVDKLFLSTLNNREIRCGLGEIVKYGALNGEIFDELIANTDKFTDIDYLSTLVYKCICHKADVVRKDPEERNGLRKTLNLGHTTGHAIELYAKRYSHGQCVMYGMFYETEIAKRLGKIEDNYYKDLKFLLEKACKPKAFFNADDWAIAALSDKKNSQNGKISLILPIAKGQTEEVTLDFEEYTRLLNQINVEVLS